MLRRYFTRIPSAVSAGKRLHLLSHVSKLSTSSSFLNKENANTVNPPSLSKSDLDTLDELYRQVSEHAHGLGFPANQMFDYSVLQRFATVPLNNCGDPWGDTHYGLNTFQFERQVIEQVAKLSGADIADTWGYVTNGGTEGNTCGVLIAREKYPNGIVYFSNHAHYSAAKIMRLLRCEYRLIDGNDDGTMNLDHFRATLSEHKHRPAIIFANVGTTMHQAVDDIPAIQDILVDVGVVDTYIHADAAFSGFILPFIDNPPPYNFSIGVDSISISGHKFIGAPIPCGVMLARKVDVGLISSEVEYVGGIDTTITGSRNGLSPLMFWVALRKYDTAFMCREVQECMEVADYAIERFKELGMHAWRHPYSITVVFPKPPDAVIDKWSIAPHGEIAHIIASRHITRTIIDGFMADLVAHSTSTVDIPNQSLVPLLLKPGLSCFAKLPSR